MCTLHMILSITKTVWNATVIPSIVDDEIAQRINAILKRIGITTSTKYAALI